MDSPSPIASGSSDSKKRKPSLKRRLKSKWELHKYLKKKQSRERYRRHKALQHIRESQRREKQKLRESGHIKSLSKTLGDFTGNNYHHIINSTALFIAAYIITYLIYQLTVMSAASYFHLQGELTYYSLEFSDSDPRWSKLNIMLITASGPVISLVLGIILIRILFMYKPKSGLMRLLMVWIAFHGLNHFFGAYAAGTATGDGFGYVAKWMNFNIMFNFILSLLALAALIYAGYNLSGVFLGTSQSMKRIGQRKRRAFFTSQALLPLLLGTLIIMLVKAPNNFNYPYETIMNFTMAFAVVPMFFNRGAPLRIPIWKPKRAAGIGYVYLLLAVVLLVVFRFALVISS